MDRQTFLQLDGETISQTERLSEKLSYTNKKVDVQTDRVANRWTDKLSYASRKVEVQTDTVAHRWTDKLSYSQMEKQSYKQEDCQSDRWTGRKKD